MADEEETKVEAVEAVAASQRTSMVAPPVPTPLATVADAPPAPQAIPTTLVAEAEGEFDEAPKLTTMRIPHTIPEIALRTYEPSADAIALPGEQDRLLRAEDFGWDAHVPQPLTYWCVLAIVDNFPNQPLMDQLPPQDRDHLIERLPTDLPLELTVPKVPDGYYWRRCCEDKWPTMNYVDEYDNSWKRMYLERYLEQYLEEMELEDYQVEDASTLASLLAPYIVRLRLRQLKVSKSLEEIEKIEYQKMLAERSRIEDEEEVMEVEKAARPETPEAKKGGVAIAMLYDVFFPGWRKEAEEMDKKKKKGRKSVAAKKRRKSKRQKKEEPPPLPPPPTPGEDTKEDREESREGWPDNWKDPCVPRDDIGLDHINLQPVLQSLKYLREFSIIFGVRTEGMQFRWEMFLFSRDDIESISRGIKDLENLNVFRLTRSTLDDTLGPDLVRGLAQAKKLLVLDLSHCRIGDRTAQALGHMLMVHPRLESMDLTNNCIGEAGVKGLAYALQQGSSAPLDRLSLRLNHIGDGGASALASALEKAMKPSVVNLAACGIGAQGALCLARALRNNHALRSLDLSNNPMGDDGGEYLAHAMSKNNSLAQMDLRMTNITPLKEFSVLMQVESNKTKLHKLSDEIKGMLKEETLDEYERTLKDRVESEIKHAEELRKELEEQNRLLEANKEEDRRVSTSFFDFDGI